MFCIFILTTNKAMIRNQVEFSGSISRTYKHLSENAGYGSVISRGLHSSTFHVTCWYLTLETQQISDA